MHFFTKYETKKIILIFFLLFFITLINLKASLRKSRDVTRKNDMGALQEAISIYHQKYRVFPLSTNSGKIIGCFEGGPDLDKITKYPMNAIPCEWDKSSFENIILMPKDPKISEGRSYLYISDGEKYELYVSLEGKKEPEYSQAVVDKNLQCGNEICNYGRWN